MRFSFTAQPIPPGGGVLKQSSAPQFSEIRLRWRFIFVPYPALPGSVILLFLFVTLVDNELVGLVLLALFLLQCPSLHFWEYQIPIFVSKYVLRCPHEVNVGTCFAIMSLSTKNSRRLSA